MTRDKQLKKLDIGYVIMSDKFVIGEEDQPATLFSGGVFSVGYSYGMRGRFTKSDSIDRSRSNSKISC